MSEKPSNNEPVYTAQIDVRDQDCAKPLVTIRAVLEGVEPGKTVLVLATWKVEQDVVRMFGDIQGHGIRVETEGKDFRIFITKK